MSRHVFLPHNHNLMLRWSLLQLTFLERSYLRQFRTPLLLNTQQTSAGILTADKFYLKVFGNFWGSFLAYPASGFGVISAYRNTFRSGLNCHRSMFISQRGVSRLLFYYWIFLGVRSAFFTTYGDIGRCLSVQNTILFESEAAATYTKFSSTIRFLTLFDAFWVGSFVPFLPLNAPPMFRSSYSTAYPFFFVASSVGYPSARIGIFTLLRWAQSVLHIVPDDSFSEVSYAFFPDNFGHRGGKSASVLNLKRVKGLYDAGSRFLKLDSYKSIFAGINTEVRSIEEEADEDFFAEFEEVDEYEVDFEFNRPVVSDLNLLSRFFPVFKLRWPLFLGLRYWYQPLGFRVMKSLGLTISSHIRHVNYGLVAPLLRAPAVRWFFPGSAAAFTPLRYFNYNNLTKPEYLFGFLLSVIYRYLWVRMLHVFMFFNVEYFVWRWVRRLFNFFLVKFGGYLFTIRIFFRLFFFRKYVKLRIVSHFLYSVGVTFVYLRAILTLFCGGYFQIYLNKLGYFASKFYITTSKLVLLTFSCIAILPIVVNFSAAIAVAETILLLLLRIVYPQQSLNFRPLANVFTLTGGVSFRYFMVVAVCNSFTRFAYLVWFKLSRLGFYIDNVFRVAAPTARPVDFVVKIQQRWYVPSKSHFFLFFRLTAPYRLFCQFIARPIWGLKIKSSAGLLASLKPSALLWVYFSATLNVFGSFGWWVDSLKQNNSNFYLRALYTAHLLQNNLLVTYYTSLSFNYGNIVVSLWLLFFEIFAARGWLKPFSHIGKLSYNSNFLFMFFERYYADLSGENFLSRLLDSRESLWVGKGFLGLQTLFRARDAVTTHSVSRMPTFYLRQGFWFFQQFVVLSFELTAAIILCCVRGLLRVILGFLSILLILALSELATVFIVSGLAFSALFYLTYALINFFLLYFFVSRAISFFFLKK